VPDVRLVDVLLVRGDAGGATETFGAVSADAKKKSLGFGDLVRHYSVEVLEVVGGEPRFLIVVDDHHAEESEKLGQVKPKTWRSYLAMAAPGIQAMELKTRTKMRTTDQVGHSCFTVSPLDGTHAAYPEPSTAISTKLATKMESIARGDKYFQQINQ
jgi:hypothetical protein